MKRILVCVSFLLAMVVLWPESSFAQIRNAPPPPPDDPVDTPTDVPLDGGLAVLLVVGASYGLKKIDGQWKKA